MFKRFIFFWVASLALAMTSIAQADEAVTYAPDYCEFSVTFPAEPYKVKVCEDENKERCYEQVTYTQVYELDTSVNFRVICNETTENIREKYTGDVMKATLRAMTKDKVVQMFDTTYREADHYKQAGLVGEGKVGRTSTMYIAQMWIGDKSAFTIEAEMSGAQSEQADLLFRDVLRSVGYIPELETQGKTAPE